MKTFQCYIDYLKVKQISWFFLIHLYTYSGCHMCPTEMAPVWGTSSSPVPVGFWVLCEFRKWKWVGKHNTATWVLKDQAWLKCIKVMEYHVQRAGLFFFLHCSIYQWSVSKWCTRLVHCTFQIQMAHTQELNLQCFGICPKGCAIVHNTADYTGLLLQVNAVYGGYKKLCIRMRANGLQEFWIFSAHYMKGYIMVQIQ